MSLIINKELQYTTLILYFNGTMDISTAHIFNEEHLLHQPNQTYQKILLDFHNLEFIDSTGIGFLMEIFYYSNEYNKTIQFRGLSELNREIFEMIGLLHLLNEFKGEMV